MTAMFLGLASPWLLAGAMSIAPGRPAPARACEDLHVERIAHPTSLPPAAPAVRRTTGGSVHAARTRTERPGAALAARLALYRPTGCGAIAPPPPVMIRHPKASPSSSRDPTVPAL